MSVEIKVRGSAKRSTRGRTLRLLAYLLMCVPPAMTLWAIHEYGVNVPYYDDWDFTGQVLDRWLHGKLTLGLLFAQHMEHRVLLPRVILFGLALVTHWHTKAGMYANVVIVLVIAGLLMRLLARNVSLASARAIFAMLLVSALLFGLIQWEIWLWSPGMQIPLIALLLISGISIAATRWRFWIRAILCALLALLATYSSGNGFLLWLLLPPVLLMESQTRRSQAWLFVSVWTAVAVSGIALYFVHYTKPASGEPPTTVDPIQVLGFLFRYLGGSIGGGTSAPETMSLLAGAVLVLIWVAVLGSTLWRRDRASLQRLLPWLCLGAYSIATGVMIAVVRASGGASVALSSRYVGYSVYLPVSLAFICAGNGLMRAWRYAAAGFFAVVLLLHLHTTAGAITWLELARAVRAQARCTLRYVDLVSPEQIVVALNPYPDFLRETAHRLNDAGYLQPPLARSDEVPEASIANDNQLAQIVEMARVGDSFHLVGWIVPELGNDSIGAIALTTRGEDGRYRIIALSTGAARTDTSRPMDTLTSPIWHAEIPAERLQGDPHALVLWGIHMNSFRFTRLEAPQ
jgi:hypothetical protein